MTKKTYEIPQELVNMSYKASAYRTMGSLYVKMPFGYNKALKSFTKATELETNFWGKVRALYPELQNKALSFDGFLKCVFIKDD